MIDADGFRPNVGIIVCNRDGRLLWARRSGQQAWQFPQGGIQQDEDPEAAMFRELQEEIGLTPDQVEVLASTSGWLRYRLPSRFIRRHQHPVCIGQKQVWFLLRMLVDDAEVRLNGCDHPEFDCWRWVNFWYPLQEVVAFKRRVYECALAQFAAVLFPDQGLPETVAARMRQRYRRVRRRNKAPA